MCAHECVSVHTRAYVHCCTWVGVCGHAHVRSCFQELSGTSPCSGVFPAPAPQHQQLLHSSGSFLESGTTEHVFIAMDVSAFPPFQLPGKGIHVCTKPCTRTGMTFPGEPSVSCSAEHGFRPRSQTLTHDYMGHSSPSPPLAGLWLPGHETPQAGTNQADRGQRCSPSL